MAKIRGEGARPVREHRTERVQIKRRFARTKHLNCKGECMESQAFVPAAYSFRPIDLILPDDFEDENDTDVRWLEYCCMAASVPRDEVLAVVLDELNSPTSPLFDLIDDALTTPHPEPDRPRTNVTELIKLGQAILNMVAKAVDDQVSMRMAVEVPHD